MSGQPYWPWQTLRGYSKNKGLIQTFNTSMEFGKRKGPHDVALFSWGVFNSQGGVAALNCWFEFYV